MSRLTSTDDAQSGIVKLADGNPGAVRVLCELFHASPIVDPIGVTGFAPLDWLDTWEVYGPHIWLLYKDICGEDIVQMLTAIRAAQLDIIPSSDLTTAIQLADAPSEQTHHGFISDFDGLLEQVRERVPEFAKKRPRLNG